MKSSTLQTSFLDCADAVCGSLKGKTPQELIKQCSCGCCGPLITVLKLCKPVAVIPYPIKDISNYNIHIPVVLFRNVDME